MRILMMRLWWRLLLMAARRLATARGFCANRSWASGRVGRVEFNLILEDLGREPGYSRDELLKMLRTVRKHEKIQGWSVPE